MRESKLMPCRPNKLTKSTLTHHVEYGCAEDYEMLEEDELRELKMLADQEMSNEDMKAFEDIVSDLAC